MDSNRGLWHKTAMSLLLVFVCGCGNDKTDSNEPRKSEKTDPEIVMKLESSGFEDAGKIKAKFTEDGQDVSPPLTWSKVPAGTKSFALVCDDPDAPSPRRPAATPWVHWVIFNIPADQTRLNEGVSRRPEPAEVPGAKQGVNSWPSDNLGYRGPAPPPGSGQHRYFFKLYALDTLLDLDAGATKNQLLESMSGHVLGEGQMIGTYER